MDFVKLIAWVFYMVFTTAITISYFVEKII